MTQGECLNVKRKLCKVVKKLIRLFLGPYTLVSHDCSYLKLHPKDGETEIKIKEGYRINFSVNRVCRVRRSLLLFVLVVLK